MIQWHHRAPSGNSDLRASIYAGDIYQLPATVASRQAVEEARELLRDGLGVDEPRRAHQELSPDQLFARIGRIRRVMFLERHWHQHVHAMVESCGFDAKYMAVDPIRLRVISHRGHENPRAKAVYLPHRDTWYAHPQAVITWWIPLHDLGPEETFWLYPERFDRAIANDSEIFNYDDWVRDGWELKIGWQQRDSGIRARYPSIVGKVDEGPARGFATQSGENLLFSGSHFHATRKQCADRTRYSLDFRVVDLRDLESGRGAPEVDRRCRGSAMRDYVRLADVHT